MKGTVHIHVPDGRGDLILDGDNPGHMQDDGLRSGKALKEGNQGFRPGDIPAVPGDPVIRGSRFARENQAPDQAVPAAELFKDGGPKVTGGAGNQINLFHGKTSFRKD
jgi:hypothetical protein